MEPITSIRSRCTLAALVPELPMEKHGVAEGLIYRDWNHPLRNYLEKYIRRINASMSDMVKRNICLTSKSTWNGQVREKLLWIWKRNEFAKLFFWATKLFFGDQLSVVKNTPYGVAIYQFLSVSISQICRISRIRIQAYPYFSQHWTNWRLIMELMK